VSIDVRPGTARGIGRAESRLEGRDKVTGRARYAVEQPIPDAVYGWPVQSTFAKGRVTGVDAGPALNIDGVLAVLWHGNAPRLRPGDNPELLVLQRPDVAYHGQVIALVVATSVEHARHGADLLTVLAERELSDTELRADHPGLYTPDLVNAGYPTDTAVGDFDAGMASARVRVDAIYRTPAEHNNPMEPHATTAVWEGDQLTVFDSTQASTAEQEDLAGLFDLPPQQVRVVNQHVGGGFGAKGSTRPAVVLAAMAARSVGRPVKLALTRRQMFAMVGYRTPTIQRVRLGADTDGRLVAIGHDALSQTSTLAEFVEQTAVFTRMMYAGPHRRTTHRVVRLDVPTPSWMRAPGECPGSFAVESAMDELAAAGGWDPVRLRIWNEPSVDPERGVPFSSRNLVACLREGAARFGWDQRDPRPGARREGRWLIGTGVAGSTYPAYTRASTATARAERGGAYHVNVNAADIGTGARTVMRQIAADALDVDLAQVTVSVGDSALGPAPVAGGSMGTSSWGWAVTKACRELTGRIDREHGGTVPSGGVEAHADTTPDLAARSDYARHAFGAQFCRVRVDSSTAEVRVDRLLGVFAAGHIVNPITARSQLIGGMTMGVSAALLEEGLLDPQFGDYVNHDLASYHVAANADVRDVEVAWVDEEDQHLNPMGTKGIGEIGIVGTTAAVANAVYHATGIRVRDLPIRLDKLIDRLPTAHR
jgi:xanthine dehydrogenase YagR molybdenum-binding subunit